MKSRRLLVIACVALVATLLAPAVAEARGATRTGHSSPPRISMDISLTCLGERGAIAEITITNNGRRAVTLVEFAPNFVFFGPDGEDSGIEVAILIIPTVLQPGETFRYTLTLSDEILPSEPWVNFHARGSVSAQAWFAGFPRPVVQQLGPLGCR